MIEAHSFHIPVMGIGFTIDTPVKVAQYGISSSISLIDDILIERMRKYYCQKFNLPYQAITDKMTNYRADRITAYLNLMNEIIEKKFDELKQSVFEKGNALEKYIDMLPNFSNLKQSFDKLIQQEYSADKVWDWVKNNLPFGDIDVNIMTKLDRAHYDKDEQQPIEYNDAHAALRGFANSKLNSSVILSAGMNPRLYSYFENFDDFFPDEKGRFKKKIILKVSDYRSAFIQGKFFAKKGIWVSEYRIESGLNCGGHAFATDGNLLGTVLEEFKSNRNSLTQEIFDIFSRALKSKERPYPDLPPEVKITAQGGVGTSEEHDFLLDYYELDSVGWGTPFLLVPEATSVDENTLKQLGEAREEDLYLSQVSPLGVPFNNLRGNTKDLEKMEFVKKGRPGSKCIKEFAKLSGEFTEKPICIASRQYQDLKIKELESKGLAPEAYKAEFDKVVEKTCLCVGLGTSALKEKGMGTKREGEGVSVCPGPNIAYFSKVVTLKEMIDHIYGKTNIIERNDRPNMFVKELRLYIDYFKNKIEESSKPVGGGQLKKLEKFQKKLNEGIEYYKGLFSSLKTRFETTKMNIFDDLEALGKELDLIDFNSLVVNDVEP